MKRVLRNKDSGNVVERYVKSFCHAIEGIVYAIRYEHNMIIIVLAAIITVVAGVYFSISTAEWLFCILVIGLVMGSEMLNTAIEAVVDLETLNIHPLAKIAKDAASSATLIFSIAALIGGIIIFLPKLEILFNTLTIV